VSDDGWIRLGDLEINETSGVDAPANRSSGWLVMKSDTATTTPVSFTLNVSTSTATAKPVKKSDLSLVVRSEAIQGAMAKRAEQLRGIWVDPLSFRRQALKATLDERAGKAFEVTDHDETIRVIARGEVEKRAVSATKQEAPVAQANDEPTTPAEQIAKDIVGRADPVAAKNIQAVIDEYRRQRHPDPVRKAREVMAGGSVTTRVIKERAAELRGQGLTVDQANAQAAREMEKALLHRHQESSRPTVTKARADLGAVIKAARLAERVPVETIAGRAGVTPRTVQLWEAGQATPDNPLKVAKALGLDPLAFAESVEKVRKEQS
jgi:DNA-binding transcriptional regulator YiaG